jgi:hypothetical protein
MRRHNFFGAGEPLKLPHVAAMLRVVLVGPSRGLLVFVSTILMVVNPAVRY